MSDQRPTRDTMSLEKATLSSMWVIAALVGVFERKSLRTKQDLYDIINDLRSLEKSLTGQRPQQASERGRFEFR